MAKDKSQETRDDVEQEEKIEKKPFSTGNIYEDLIGWASRLDALGALMSSLASFEESDELITSGEYLGYIISDYAKAINLSVHEAGNVFWRAQHGVYFSISDHKDSYEMIRQGAYYPEKALEVVNREIKELNSFIKEVADPVIELEVSYEQLRRAIIKRIEENKQKEAPATVGAVTAA
ncbi:MAG: hypothetical protein PHT49_06380 [Desulfovibrionales bacterium]|nr:hypothetical protein [Desulfovibrionales bacterium]